VLEKEIERSGIPAVLVTALVPTATTLHANRIVQGKAITHPFGDPRLTRRQEKALRRKIVERALEALTQTPQKDSAREEPFEEKGKARTITDFVRESKLVG
jgi:glycine reductase complex component B subunit gamma